MKQFVSRVLERSLQRQPPLVFLQVTTVWDRFRRRICPAVRDHLVEPCDSGSLPFEMMAHATEQRIGAERTVRGLVIAEADASVSAALDQWVLSEIARAAEETVQ